MDAWGKDETMDAMESIRMAKGNTEGSQGRLLRGPRQLRKEGQEGRQTSDII